jgi:hypothetical protein
VSLGCLAALSSAIWYRFAEAVLMAIGGGMMARRARVAEGKEMYSVVALVGC